MITNFTKALRNFPGFCQWLPSIATTIALLAIATSSIRPRAITPQASREGKAPRLGPPRPEDPARLEILVTTAKRDYRPLEPIELNIVMKNVSKFEMIRIRMNYEIYPTIEIAVTDDNGRPIPKTRYLMDGGMHKTCGIPARGEYRPELLANLVNDMTQPGEYKITVKVTFAGEGNVGLHRRASSEPIIVKVRGTPFTGRPDPPIETNPDADELSRRPDRGQVSDEAIPPRHLRGRGAVPEYRLDGVPSGRPGGPLEFPSDECRTPPRLADSDRP